MRAYLIFRNRGTYAFLLICISFYFFTVTLQVTFLEPEVTVITAVPFFFAFIFPFAFTETTDGFELR